MKNKKILYIAIPIFIFAASLSAKFLISSPFGEGGLRGIYNWIFKGGAGGGILETEASAPRAGLVGWWTMDNNDVNGTTIYDKSGQGNNGTMTGTTASTGKIGQARSFNGTSDYVQIKSSDLVATNAASTVSAWIKTSAISSTDRSIYSENIAIGTVYLLRVDATAGAGEFYVLANGSTSKFATGAKRIDDNKWHFVVGTLGSAGQILYVDGVRDGFDANTSPTSGTITNVRMGMITNAGIPNYFNGSIDDVRVYNRALSAAEVSQLYNSTKTSYTNAPTRTASSTASSGGRQLIGHWTMDSNDISGTTIYDKSGLNNSGVGTNITTADLAAGKIKQSMDFGGDVGLEWVNLFTNSPSTTTLSPTSAITYSAWVKRNTESSYRSVVCNLSSNVMVDGACLHWNDGTYINRFGFRVNGANNIAVASQQSLADNQWHFVVGTYDKNASSNQVNIYVDGIKGTPDTLTENINYPADSVLAIGRGGNANNYYWNGNIDDVRIYNYALSEQEVSNLYNSAKSSYVNATVRRTGLVLNLDFGNNDNTSAPTVYDTSGYNRHATSTAGSTAPTCGKKFCDFDGTDYMTADASGVFGSLQTSVVMKFSPDFDVNDGVSHVFYDSVPVATTRYLISKHSDNTLIVYLGGSNWAIPLASYQNFWKKGKENILILVASDSAPDTNKVWLNGNSIYNGNTAWSNDPETSICVGKQCNSTPIFDGKIHYLKIWNRALTDNEVAILSADRETNE